MNKRTKLILTALIILSITIMHSQCYAQTAIRKLGRGAANIGTGAFEIPKSIQEKFYDNGPVAAVTYGVLDGCYKFVLRTVVGIYEVATFPIPFPAEYAPVVEPEFLFSPDEPYSFE